MRLYIHLYMSHDPDLCKLFLTPDFNFAAGARRALRAYMTGKAPKQPLPVNASNVKGNNRVIRTVVNLRPGRDDDLIAYMGNVKSGYRNIIVKHALRYYYNMDSIWLNKSPVVNNTQATPQPAVQAQPPARDKKATPPPTGKQKRHNKNDQKRPNKPQYTPPKPKQAEDDNAGGTSFADQWGEVMGKFIPGGGD